MWRDARKDTADSRVLLGRATCTTATGGQDKQVGTIHWYVRRQADTMVLLQHELSGRCVVQDKKYKKKVLQAKMGDLQNKLGEIYPERGERSSVAEQPGGLQQQYYQKILPQGAGQPAPRAGEPLPKRDDRKRGGFFTSLKRLVPSKKDSAVASDDELNQTLQLLETIDRDTKTRDQGAGSAADGDQAQRKPQATSIMGPSEPANVPAAMGREGPVRKSRSRASFQLQSTAPVSKPAGLPADPHDGGPHEDVKDMATYLRLDPQRDYRFMWVSQVR